MSNDSNNLHADSQHHAVAYLRTSSSANVGADKDSETRQRLAISNFAALHGMTIVAEFRDPGVSGVDPVQDRPGFAAMLDRIEGNGVRTILVEDASRFARSLMAQEMGVVVLQRRGVRVLTASGDDLTNEEDTSRVFMRQVAGAAVQYEKARLVQKLRAARERKRASAGRCEGRKSYAETAPALVERAKELRADDLNYSLREIADLLAKDGFTNTKGEKLTAMQVSRVLRQPSA